jgi:hypothetical protein
VDDDLDRDIRVIERLDDLNGVVDAGELGISITSVSCPSAVGAADHQAPVLC